MGRITKIGHQHLRAHSKDQAEQARQIKAIQDQIKATTANLIKDIEKAEKQKVEQQKINQEKERGRAINNSITVAGIAGSTGLFTTLAGGIPAGMIAIAAGTPPGWVATGVIAGAVAVGGSVASIGYCAANKQCRNNALADTAMSQNPFGQNLPVNLAGNFILHGAKQMYNDYRGK